jgi:hypothetical protein
MDQDPKKYGRANLAEINLLESAKFDFFGGLPPPAHLGKTESPISILPVWTMRLAEPMPPPALVLTFRLRPGTTPSAVTFDLFAAYAVLNRCEISLGGGGLAPNETQSDLTQANGVVRLVLSATEPAGAASRLAKLVEAIKGADFAMRMDILVGRSFERCEAEMRSAA